MASVIFICIVFFVNTASTRQNVNAKENSEISIKLAKEKVSKFLAYVKPVEKPGDFNGDFENIISKNDSYWKNKKNLMTNDEISIETDESGDVITFINKLKTAQQEIKNKSKIVDKELLLKRAEYISEQFSKEEKSLITSEDQFNGYKIFKWARTYKGYKYDTDFITVALDPSTGEVAAASKRFVSTKPDIQVNLNEEKAKEIAIYEIENISEFKVGNIKDINMLLVNPNYRWTNKATIEFNPNARLAYAITFERLSPLIGEVIMWIDSLNGEMLGGVVSK